MPSASARDRLHDPREFIDLLSVIDLHPAEPEECDAGRAIAAELISPYVAPAAAFRRVQAHTGSAVWVYRQAGEVTGVLGMVAVKPNGLKAIEEHLYDSKNTPEEFLCGAGDPFAAIYGWGFAARTRKASVAVVLGAMRSRERFADIPFFTRAATPAGVKVITGRMGYRPYPGAPDDLLWNPVRPSQERAA
ncbi:MAG TPA: hypothetical protein VL460_06965 [Caulobacteraceae bacterium]|jgi:hypothetical protein|nr:hypothetical protein [Caulobacteraceae bacterium]